MRNFTSTLKYIFQNFLMVFLLLIIPSVFLGSFTNTFGVSYFVANYGTTQVTGLGSIFGLLFQFSFPNVLFFVLGSVFLVILVSVYVGVVENHFRSGKQNLLFGEFLNNNVLAVLTYYAYAVFTYMVYKVLLGILLFTNHVIFSGIGNLPTMFTSVMAILFILFTFVLVVYLFNFLLLAMPATITNGYNVKYSLSDANELLNKRQHKTMLGMLLVFAFVFFFNLLGQLYVLPWVVNTVAYFVLLATIPLYSFICFYDYSLLKRYDLKGKYYLK